MSKSKEFTQFQLKLKLLNTKKLLETKECLMNALLLTTMPLKLKLNTSVEKLRRPSWLKNQSKRYMKEFNTFLLKLKLFTIPREITTYLLKLK